jgi:hypothetical protein
VKFCLKIAEMFSETSEMLQQGFGSEAMSRTQTHEWYIHFKEVRTSIEDNKCSEKPSTSRNEENTQKV